MNLGIGRDWHRSTFHFVTDFLKLFASSTLIVASPFGEIQVTAPVIHVVDDPPRKRRDVRVPWPASGVGVTVLARTIQNRSDVGWYLQVSLNSLRLINCRICSGGPYELQHKQSTYRDYHKPFQYSTPTLHALPPPSPD